MIEPFVDSVLLRLDATNSFSASQIIMIRNAVREVCERYELTPKTNEIVSYDFLQPEGYKAFFVIKKAEGLSNKTLNQYKRVIDKFLLAVMKPLENITTTDVQLYLYKKQTVDHNQTSSVNNTRRTLSSFFG